MLCDLLLIVKLEIGAGNTYKAILGSCILMPDDPLIVAENTLVGGGEVKRTVGILHEHNDRIEAVCVCLAGAIVESVVIKLDCGSFGYEECLYVIGGKDTVLDLGQSAKENEHIGCGDIYLGTLVILKSVKHNVVAPAKSYLDIHTAEILVLKSIKAFCCFKLRDRCNV